MNIPVESIIVFVYSVIVNKIYHTYLKGDMNMETEFSTTFWSDFSIADAFGVNAVKDTYKRAFKEWKDDYRI